MSKNKKTKTKKERTERAIEYNAYRMPLTDIPNALPKNDYRSLADDVVLAMTEIDDVNAILEYKYISKTLKDSNPTLVYFLPKDASFTKKVSKEDMEESDLIKYNNAVSGKNLYKNLKSLPLFTALTKYGLSKKEMKVILRICNGCCRDIDHVTNTSATIYEDNSADIIRICNIPLRDGLVDLAYVNLLIVAFPDVNYFKSLESNLKITDPVYRKIRKEIPGGMMEGLNEYFAFLIYCIAGMLNLDKLIIPMDYSTAEKLVNHYDKATANRRLLKAELTNLYNSFVGLLSRNNKLTKLLEGVLFAVPDMMNTRDVDNHEHPNYSLPVSSTINCANYMGNDLYDENAIVIEEEEKKEEAPVEVVTVDVKDIDEKIEEAVNEEKIEE